MNLDPIAVSIFANKGIALVPVAEREYCWTHDPYLKSEPPTKDLEIRIREMHYMGPIVHRVTIPNVHVEDAHDVAEKVLAEYLESNHSPSARAVR